MKEASGAADGLEQKEILIVLADTSTELGLVLAGLIAFGGMFVLVGGAVEKSKTAERVTKAVSRDDDPDPYVRGLVVGVMTVCIIVGALLLMENG